MYLTESDRCRDNYTIVFRRAFSLFNLTVLILLALYTFLLQIARPEYCGKISDVMNRIIVVSEMKRIPRDLEAFGAVQPAQIQVGEVKLPCLSLLNGKHCLFLLSGESILPKSPYVGCLYLMIMKRGGQLSPVLMQQKNGKLYFTAEGTGGHSYAVGETVKDQFLNSNIDCYDMRDAMGLAVIGENIYLLDMFTFQIPSIRSWRRNAIDLNIE
jgi:hypothetical protein